jgi:methionyl-tRNA formyltransferase
MKVIIACSKKWFDWSGDLAKVHETKYISSDTELSEEMLKNFAPDFIFFPHWNWIVPRAIHETYKCIVFHTAPLPYGRGGSPIQNLILRGFSSAPVSALRMTDKLDAGDIYDQIHIDLSGTLDEIFEKLNDAVNELITRLITNDIKPIAQEGEVTKFDRLTEDDNEIPNRLNIKQIYDRIRMVDQDEYPNAFLCVNGYKIEFNDAKIESDGLMCSAKITIVDEKDGNC